jgi:hypothetical protein
MTEQGMETRDLYLDLLKKTLTATVYRDEPNPKDPAFISGFIQHYMRGQAHTMVPLVRLNNVQECVADVLARGIPGDLIETGVWRGGLTIFMRGILKAYGVIDRRVWVADSFQGLPEPDAAKHPVEARAHHSKTMVQEYKHLAVSAEDVRANFARYGLLDEQVCFLEGWFKDTLPKAPVDRLAVMRLDGDYYESTMDALASLYPKLSPGGYVIIDDYGEDLWTNCRQAVDDFRRERAVTAPLVQVDSKCFFWRRPD